MPIQIERWFLIFLLAVSYLRRAPGLVRQGGIGLPALVVGFFLAAVLIAFLLKSSARAAGVVAALAGLGVFFGVVQLLDAAPLIRGYSPPSSLWLLPLLIAMLCAVDLWSTWRKKPNPTSEPAR